MEINVIKDGEAFERLKLLSKNAISIRAAMAYWTIPAEKLPTEFLNGLKGKGGFVYCGLQNPTSINSLLSLNNKSIDVYLNLRVAYGKSEINDSLSMPNHLMHCKVIIFDYFGNDAVIWVGSHNMTFRAMYGINNELTLDIKTRKDLPLYSNVQKYLKHIVADAHLFDKNQIDIYRFLQGQKGDKISVIELEGQSESPLYPDDTITIFNIGYEDYRSFKTVHKEIFIRIKTPSGDLLWFAEVVQSGETPAKKLQTFSSRNYVDQQNRLLVRQQDVPDYLYKPDTHYAVLEVKELIADGWCLVSGIDVEWIRVKTELNDDLREIMKEENIKGLTIKEPQFPESQSESVCSASELELQTITPLIQKMRLQRK